MASYRATLVMALSVDCAYCRESAPFYRQLTRSKAPDVNFIALFPEPVALARNYLVSNDIQIKDIRQQDLRKLQIIGTPTLVLADKSGRVQSVWAGKLPADQEREVVESVVQHGPIQFGMEQSSNDASDSAGLEEISGTEFRQLLQKESVLPVIDIRLREDYHAAHIADALNIPIDELESRAPHEVPKWPTIVIYCYYCPHCDPAVNPEGVSSSCRLTKMIMNGMGYRNLKFLKEPLPQLEREGVKSVKANGSDTNRKNGSAHHP